MSRFSRDDYNNYERDNFGRDDNNFDKSYDAREYTRDSGNNFDRRDYSQAPSYDNSRRGPEFSDPARPYDEFSSPPPRGGGRRESAGADRRPDNRYSQEPNREYNGRDNSYSERQEGSYNNERREDRYYRNSRQQYNEQGHPSNNADDVKRISEMNTGTNNIIQCEPRSYQDIQHLIDSLKIKQALIVDIGKIDPRDSQRYLDFLSGAIYALGGSYQRIAKTLFLFTPSGITITIPFDIKERQKRND